MKMRLKRFAYMMSLFSCVALASVVLASCGDDGDGGDGGEASGGKPIHAVASLVSSEDSVGPIVQARLIIVSTEGGTTRFVEDARDPILEFNGKTIELRSQRVVLSDTGQETRMYEIDSRQDSDVEYLVGSEYTFSFAVDSEAAGENSGETFSLKVVAPATGNSLQTASDPAKGSPLDVVPSQSYSSGIVEVGLTSSGEATYVSYPYSNKHLENAQQLIDKTAALKDGGGSILTIPSEAFNRSGTHTITYTGIEASAFGSQQLSGNLGVFSVAYVGAAALLQVNVP